MLVVGCGDDAGTPTGPTAASGAEIYDAACLACHGERGAGVENLGNPLAPSDFVTSRTDQELLDFIITGRGTDDPENTSGVAMPPRGGRPNISDADLLAVIAYLRTLQDG